MMDVIWPSRLKYIVTTLRIEFYIAITIMHTRTDWYTRLYQYCENIMYRIVTRALIISLMFIVGAYMVLFMQQSEGAGTKHKYHHRSKYKKRYRKDSMFTSSCDKLVWLANYLYVTFSTSLTPKLLTIFYIVRAHISNFLPSLPPRKSKKIRRSINPHGSPNRPFRLRKVRYYRRCMVLCSLLPVVHGYEHDNELSKTKQDKTDSERYKTEVFATTTRQNEKIMLFDTDSSPIKIDNCSSRSMSFSRSDFISGTLKPVQNMKVTGYSGAKVPITHKGTIRWYIADDNGTTQALVIPNSFYVPSSTTRLLSPQHFAQQANDHHPIRRGTWCATYDDSIQLQWKQRTYSLTAKLDPESSNVATIWTTAGYKKHIAYCAQSPHQRDEYECYETQMDEDMWDDRVQDRNEEFISADDNNEMTREDPLLTDFDLNGPPQSNDHDSKMSSRSDNLSSEMLKWHHRLSHISFKRIQRMSRRGQLPSYLSNCPIPTCQSCMYGKMTRRPWRTKSKQKHESLGTIDKPGDCVSVDQLESSIPGLVGQLKGKPTSLRYRVATVFVDYYSGLSYVHLQSSTSSKETLEAKFEFEKYARTHGVTIRHYHADNGRFSDNDWRDDILYRGQRLTFCGVGAHHQNGRAEKRIRDIQDLARTSLIHANKRWPDAVDARLWPYALLNANLSINKTPFPQHTESPIEMFSMTKIMPNLIDDHPFGCPVYVLDGRLQGLGRINKWASRSRLAIYLGHSSQHSQTVSLVLSLSTGLVSPQFHTRFDDTFETIRNDLHQPRSKWQIMCGFEASTSLLQHTTSQNENGSIPSTEQSEIDTSRISVDERTASIDLPVHQDTNDMQVTDTNTTASTQTTTTINEVRSQTTRSGREVRTPRHLDDFVVYCAASNSKDCLEASTEHEHPMAFAASSDPDIMYLDEALKAPDRAEFIRAMQKEVQAHTSNNNWRIIPRSRVPHGQTVLPAVWAMRRKRNIQTQEVYKWKARLNVHGGKQIKGLNYWETYAPVASWASIRLVMNLAAFLKWEIRQLDFVLAFLQAPVETDIFMEIPTGFKITKADQPDSVLHLVNNLYGQKQAGRVWNLYLADGLKALGFHQSKNDPCIFWRGKSLIVIYTDDTIVTGPDPQELDKIIADIGARFEITSQLKIDDFLGVHVARDETASTITLTQPQLIKSIIKDLGLKENSTTRNTPALSTKILHKYESSPPHNEDWHYRSVIGKLNYLEKSSRPDLAYAVHQCARFSENPRIEHTKAVKLIGRYLLATSNLGIICKPSNKSFDCYCDADFCGLWDPHLAEHDPSTARSRSGYIVLYADCPVVWASKLQTEIALSTTESEYVALSQSLREVLPLMRLVKELASAGFGMSTTQPKIHCRVFEDNSGALAMARTPKMRPRTKHMNIKYHHFREAVSKGDVTIHAIRTDEQIADIFTKPLAEELFKKFRQLMMGW
jgi:Reverse transcriptase (RNA-dependent DNA polymerase)/GAG-pre-integrase domain